MLCIMPIISSPRSLPHFSAVFPRVTSQINHLHLNPCVETVSGRTQTINMQYSRYNT